MRQKRFWSGLCLILVAIIATSCEMDMKSLERDVIDLMIEKTQEEGHRLTISGLHLVHEGGNYYTGIATGTFDGARIELNVAVVCDGASFQAEWAPTEAYLQKQAEQAQQEFERGWKREVQKLEREEKKAMEEWERELRRIEREQEREEFELEMKLRGF